MRKIAIVGSGFAAWGAALALTRSRDVRVQVLDIGLTAAECPLADRPVPNAKKCDGSYFCYGINDARSPLSLTSERMCSSHAMGGYSLVYSGAVLYPKDGDLGDWPADSRPKAEDYAAVLARLPLLHETDRLDTVFPLIPSRENLTSVGYENDEISLAGASRIAVSHPDAGAGVSVQPFRVSDEFRRLRAEGVLQYTANCYVSHLKHEDGRIHVFFSKNGDLQEESFDAVFIGAGCVNTTAIIDRSIGQPGIREYLIHAPGAAIHAFLRFPWPSRKAIRIRKRHGLPEYFVEVRSPSTGNSWLHTQLTGINEQIIDAICSRVPRFLHPVVNFARHVVYFALSSQKSDQDAAAILRSSVQSDATGATTQSVTIVEHPTSRRPRLVRAVRWAVLRHWSSLLMMPFPFGETLADFFRRNRLGGWHFGGTLPMRENPAKPGECRPTAEVHGLPGVFVVDSSAFPSIPASTVALLTAAHAHRVARHWLGQSPHENK